MSKTARMSHDGACLARMVAGELPEICQRRRLVTPGAAPLDLASPWPLSCDVVVQRIGERGARVARVSFTRQKSQVRSLSRPPRIYAGHSA
jgi:hypothetical protein